MLLTLVLKALEESFALMLFMIAVFSTAPFTFHPPFAVFASQTSSF